MAGTYVCRAMLLVENLPQPEGLIVSGNARERKSRLQAGVLCRLPRHGVTVASDRWPEPVFHL